MIASNRDLIWKFSLELSQLRSSYVKKQISDNLLTITYPYFD